MEDKTMWEPFGDIIMSGLILRLIHRWEISLSRIWLVEIDAH